MIFLVSPHKWVGTATKRSRQPTFTADALRRAFELFFLVGSYGTVPVRLVIIFLLKNWISICHAKACPIIIDPENSQLCALLKIKGGLLCLFHRPFVGV